MAKKGDFAGAGSFAIGSLSFKDILEKVGLGGGAAKWPKERFCWDGEFCNGL
jgi:hypothetical protein